MNVIKKYRMLAGMTQDELAKKIGAKGGSVIYAWETKNRVPTPKYLKRLLETLKIPADEMIEFLEGAGL